MFLRNMDKAVLPYALHVTIILFLINYFKNVYVLFCHTEDGTQGFLDEC